jgi:hypothetical protein
MLYLGNFQEDETVDFKFTTPFSGAQPSALSGGTVSVYQSNSTTTEVTTGVTLSADFDGITGLNHVRIVTTDAFYAVGEDYMVVLTAGTVGGTSFAGTVLAHFSISNRFTNVQAIDGDENAPGDLNAMIADYNSANGKPTKILRVVQAQE